MDRTRLFLPDISTKFPRQQWRWHRGYKRYYKPLGVYPIGRLQYNMVKSLFPFGIHGCRLRCYRFLSSGPRYGTNDDLRQLFEEAHNLGMKVVLDLVAGHSSDQSPWFKYSQQKQLNSYSDRYIWTNDSTLRPDKFVSGKFERNGTYRKNYFDCQPAFNYGYGEPDPSNPWEEPITAAGPTATRQELMRIMDYWMQMGCDGFRVDLAGSLIKNDPQLKSTTYLWHEIRTHFQSLYPEGILLAEWSNPQRAIQVGFMMDFILCFGNTGYSQMMFNQVGTYRKDTCYFDLKGIGNPNLFTSYLKKSIHAVGDKGHICIPTSNHDFQRPNCGPRNSVEQLKASMTFFLRCPVCLLFIMAMKLE